MNECMRNVVVNHILKVDSPCHYDSPTFSLVVVVMMMVMKMEGN